MRLQEGDQYFVNRINFVGNTTTRDNVVRREMRLLEGGVFNTEAMKMSVRKINQLGYFKNIEEGPENPKVEKVAGEKNKVDVTFKFEEQNRNQLTFGAGVSQFEGFFGQLAFQTSNFMGRGESATFSVLAGKLAQNYQVAFSEPYLFDRPITAGIDVFKRELRYQYAYTQESAGTNLTFGFPVRDFTRAFVTYSLERVGVKDLNPLYLDPAFGANNPFLADALLLGENGKRTISQVTPSIIHNTIDNPIFPTQGRRYTATMDFAGLGGNVRFVKPMLEGVWIFRHTSRTSLGLRGQWAYIKPYANSILPIYERLFLGGEYSVRGYDIRSIGPRDPATGLVIGGDKSLLANAEYIITVFGPLRLVLFYDAGQVQDTAPAIRLAGLEDVDGRGNPLLHAGPERAVPPHRCREPAAVRRPRQQPPAHEGVRIQVCRGFHLLGLKAEGERLRAQSSAWNHVRKLCALGLQPLALSLQPCRVVN